MNELLTMLDSKYKRLEYIRNTSSVAGDCFINTGIYDVDRIECRARLNTFYQYSYLFGNYIDENQHNIIRIISEEIETNSFLAGIASVPQTYIQTSNTSLYDFHNFILYENNNNMILDVDGVSFSKTKSVGLENTTPIVLFSKQLNNSNRTWVGDMAYWRAYKNNVLVRNMIPVMRKSDNEIGMLDLVEGKFYHNAGTGKFTANLDTMYALIQGTPTVQDGRVSGFSSANYIEINKSFDNINTIEETVSITTGASVTSEQWIIIGGFSTSVYTNGKLVVYHSGGLHTFSKTVLQPNTDYVIKLIYKNGKLLLYINNNLEFEVSVTFSGSITRFRYGSNANASFFKGTIDFNNTYIKIDDTKYKLQAVVGYTIVGSPTIVDGVVSGFSSSNYLRLQNSFSLGNNFEIKTKVVTSSDVTSQQVIFSGLAGQYINFCIQNGKTQQNIGNGELWEITQAAQTFGETTIETNTTYYLRFTFDGSAYRLYLSTDNINWILDWKYESVTIIPSCQYVWGVSRNSQSVFNGSIDLKKTYIKINNKLWFNGLPNDN